MYLVRLPELRQLGFTWLITEVRDVEFRRKCPVSFNTLGNFLKTLKQLYFCLLKLIKMLVDGLSLNTSLAN